MDSRERLVAVLKKNTFTYPAVPFNPPEEYPELRLLPYKIETDPANHVYSMIRKMFSMYKLDYAHYGTEKWNPLCETILEGSTVAIKPNLVTHKHPFGGKTVLSTITHSSLLRPIIDYVTLALKGKGKIIVCDSPLQFADFNKICEINGLRTLIDFYKSRSRGIQLSLFDLRKEMTIHPMSTFLTRRVPLQGDPLGYTIVDIGGNSFHQGIQGYWKKYAVTGYDLKNLRNYHTDKKHCYFLSNTILTADAIISVPKLKTHMRTGITVALKNFIGINPSKDFLPHYRTGDPQEGGDEYPSEPNRARGYIKGKIKQVILNTPIVRKYASLFSRKYLSGKTAKDSEITEGCWHGNDTLWRTILDLNTIVKYVDKNGMFCSSPQRKFMFIVDGIIGQEGEGPLDGCPKKCGTLILGLNPSAVDYVAAKIVGFNHLKIKQVTEPFKRRRELMYPIVEYDVRDIEVVSNVNSYARIHELTREKSLKFLAPKGWKTLEEA